LGSFSLAFLCTSSSCSRNGSIEFAFQRLNPLVKNLDGAGLVGGERGLGEDVLVDE